MPEAEIPASELTDGSLGLLTVLVKAGLAPSISEARRLVQQGGITVNDEKITDPKAQIKLTDGEVVVRKGKKAFKKIVVK